MTEALEPGQIECQMVSSRRAAGRALSGVSQGYCAVPRRAAAHGMQPHRRGMSTSAQPAKEMKQKTPAGHSKDLGPGPEGKASLPGDVGDFMFGKWTGRAPHGRLVYLVQDGNEIQKQIHQRMIQPHPSH